jgi:hypothetical protein
VICISRSSDKCQAPSVGRERHAQIRRRDRAIHLLQHVPRTVEPSELVLGIDFGRSGPKDNRPRLRYRPGAIEDVVRNHRRIATQGQPGRIEALRKEFGPPLEDQVTCRQIFSGVAARHGLE